MNNRDNSNSEPTGGTPNTSRFTVPPLSLNDDERALIEADPYEFVVVMKNDGARDAEITSKLRLANIPASEVTELMERASQFVKENRFELGRGRLKNGLVLLALGIAAIVLGVVIGFRLILWGGVILSLVGGGQTVRGAYHMMTGKREANVGTE